MGQNKEVSVLPQMHNLVQQQFLCSNFYYITFLRFSIPARWKFFCFLSKTEEIIVRTAYTV